MKLVKLKIGNDDSVGGVFGFAARVAGNAVVYAVWAKAKDAPTLGRALLPDEGDDNAPGVEVLDPVHAGFTPNGRSVYVFRSGEQSGGGWTGRSFLYAALTGATADREAGHSVVVNVSEPGPVGPPGPPGRDGVDGEGGGMTEDQMRALLRAELGGTVQTVSSLSSQMWPDLVGRIKNVPADTANQTAAKVLGGMQDTLANATRDDADLAEAVWTGLAAEPNHFNLPEDAQQGLWWQDAMVYAMRDFLASQSGQQLLAQAVTSALVEGKIIPSVTKNPQPLVNE
jgi:hypothetical protein